MRRTVLILVALAAIVVVEIAWLAPASVLGSRIEQASAGTLRLADSEGTIWRARGMLVADGSRLPIAWNLEFWPLLRGEARLHVSPYAGTASGPPRANIVLRAGTATVNDADLVAPAAMVAVLVPALRSWSVGGDVRASAGSFEWSPPANRGAARIVWQRAQLTPPGSSETVNLGTVTLDLAADGDGVRGPIRNDGGELRVNGTLEWRAGGRSGLALALVPAGAPTPALANALAALGASAANDWRVEWRSPAP